MPQRDCKIQQGLITALLLSLFPWFAVANVECAAVEPLPAFATGQPRRDTEKASEELKTFFANYEIDHGIDAINQMKIKVLTRHIHANQKFVVKLALYDYCMILMNSSLSDELKGQARSKAEKILGRKPPDRRCVFSTWAGAGNQCRGEPAVKAPEAQVHRLLFASSNQTSEQSFRFVRTAAAADPDSEIFSSKKRAPLPQWSDDGSEELNANAAQEKSRYLWDTPYVINDANSHFVIASSVYSCDGPHEPIEEAERLKREAPEFDFSVFAPVPGNECWYAIMAATWTTRDIQSEVLRKIRPRIPDAQPWSCKRTGEHCL